MQALPESDPVESDLILRIGRYIALIAILGLAAHLYFRFGPDSTRAFAQIPLYVVLILGGIPLLIDLGSKVLRREFGADLLAGISILTSIMLGEYLAGSLVVLMLSGGEALEAYAMRRASSVLAALAKRMPSIAHRRSDAGIVDVPASEIAVGDVLSIFPHEICPVDGVVVEGSSAMDEAYLTGEPFLIKKGPGTEVVSGAINGEGALTIKALRLAKDSRYAKIMEVMDASQQRRPRIRRLADVLGAWYTPLAVIIAVGAWLIAGDSTRFLAVLVIATPCPLLIAIPVAIVGTISLSAKRGIIIKDPAILERIDRCSTIIFDKTGTLTYGRPSLSAIITAAGQQEDTVLALSASVEKYSKHPLASAVIAAAEEKGLSLVDANNVEERPGAGMQAEVGGISILITGRNNLSEEMLKELPPLTGGLECVVLLNKQYAATLQFHDEPRHDTRPFIRHLPRKHGISKVILLSGDRESEVSLLAKRVGIKEVYAGKSPEEKVEIVRQETAKAPTVFLGDGINDAPALAAATVGVAFGPKSDITSEAAGAVVLEPSLEKVDELLHIGARMRSIALQSALGGMLLSVFGMGFAATGYLNPVQGAIAQELIDLLAVVNALRASSTRFRLSDF